LKKNSILATAEKIALIAGCCALLATTVIMVLSVIGRHTQIPLPGSVEIIEVLIVIVASTSLLVATVQNTHASAKLFIDRLSPTLRHVVEKCGYLFGACFSLALLVGNVWLILDYWPVTEASHLLSIPIIPFRVLLSTILFIITLLLLRRLFSSETDNKPLPGADGDE
jgi:TRAP-type C4-dicarboxylate transport system permease small subunit